MRRTLWATTECRGNLVKLWKWDGKTSNELDGYTIERKHHFDVYIAARVFESERFLETIIHEALHVVEACFSKTELQPRRIGTCTPLADHAGKALAEMLRQLKPPDISRRE